jgi:hypothetical protein
MREEAVRKDKRLTVLDDGDGEASVVAGNTVTVGTRKTLFRRGRHCGDREAILVQKMRLWRREATLTQGTSQWRRRR